MPTVNLKPNSTSKEYFIEIDVEAVPAEDDVPAGLAVNVQYDGNELADVWEPNADAIREFRDLVVAECDKALARIAQAT